MSERNITTTTTTTTTTTFNNNNNNNILQMIGDSLITWPNYRTLNMQSNGMKSDVYFYYFGYIGTFSLAFNYENPESHFSGKFDDIFIC